MYSIYYYYFALCEFFASVLIGVNVVVGMISILSLIPDFSSLLHQAFVDRPKCINYDWYRRHFHVSQHFLKSLYGKIQVFSVVHWNSNTSGQVLIFFVN